MAKLSKRMRAIDERIDRDKIFLSCKTRERDKATHGRRRLLGRDLAHGGPASS